MGASSSIMAGAYGVQGLNSIVSSRNQAQAIKLQGAYQKQQADANARLAMIRADDASRAGDLKAGAARRKGSAILGAQRVAAAAQGVDINSGSAADLQLETDQMSEIDVNQIKNNAWREAWGYQVQANDLIAQGNMAATSAKYNARATVLTGNINAAASFMQAGANYQKGNENTPQGFKPDPNGESVFGKNDTGEGGSIFSKDAQEESAKSLEQSDYNDDWRNYRGGGRSRSNPLYPGYGMTDSWWITDGE